jgi:phenylacetic acid degradation operon negative regulatory protein
MLARGDRRIYNHRQMRPEDPWCLVSFSIPEERRDIRYQLRRRLQWIGCGNISPALWICPDFLSGEVEDILADLEVRDQATLFRTERPRTGGPLADSVAQWWDLEMLAGLHRSFIDRHTPDAELPPWLVTPEAAFRAYITSIDTWRILPYLDPGLPADLLPENWPGQKSMHLFAALSEKHRDLSHEYVETIVSGPAPHLSQLTTT